MHTNPASMFEACLNTGVPHGAPTMSIPRVGQSNQRFVTYPNGILETALSSPRTALNSSGTIFGFGTSSICDYD